MRCSSSYGCGTLLLRFIDKSRSRETGGTGLGLAIVKHIAEIHDAKIKVESEAEQGTCITVLFKASAPGSQNPSAI